LCGRIQKLRLGKRKNLSLRSALADTEAGVWCLKGFLTLTRAEKFKKRDFSTTAVTIEPLLYKFMLCLKFLIIPNNFTGLVEIWLGEHLEPTIPDLECQNTTN